MPVKYPKIYHGLMNTAQMVHEKHRQEWAVHATLLMGFLENDICCNTFHKDYPMEAFLMITSMKRDTIKNIMSEDAYNYFKDCDADEQKEMMLKATENREKAAALFLDFGLSCQKKGYMTKDQVDWCIMIASLMQAEGALMLIEKVEGTALPKIMVEGVRVSIQAALDI